MISPIAFDMGILRDAWLAFYVSLFILVFGVALIKIPEVAVPFLVIFVAVFVWVRW